MTAAHENAPLYPESWAKAVALLPQETVPLAQAIRRALAQDGSEAEPAKASLNETELTELLCQLRRREWARNILQAAHRNGEIWIGGPQARKAAALIHAPSPTAQNIRSALSEALRSEWREKGTDPKQVLDAVTDELTHRGQRLSLKEIRELSAQMARAFGKDASVFSREMAEAEQYRLANQKQISRRAAARQSEENERLRKWQETLLSFNQLLNFLHCSRREALRWMAEQKIPVAKRLELGQGREEYLFDPEALAHCKQLMPHWRGENTEISAPARTPAPNENAAQNAAIARVAGLDRFVSHFHTARALKRHIILITGPTNSGKSYSALEALAKAKNGLALAPLRLLAHEFRDSLLARGVPASLTTGEERLIDPAAHHLAATVEMCPFSKPVEVAVIDEAQMLADPDRGAAWTAAIMGVPAQEIYILGAEDCIPLVRRIAELCGDTLDEIHLERKSPLKTGGVLKLGELKKGDALIAFSRRGVLDLRAALMAKGKKVAVIYGALSPEVRRAEAARFNNGAADILIATDAIGMGLNLSIKRVVFSSLHKFDGRDMRQLTMQEVKQIGGRAGRYGKHEAGEVCVLEGAGSPAFIHQMLTAEPEEMKELRPQVQPDSDIIHAVADEIKSDNLYGVLNRIKHAVLQPNDPNYRLADMEQALEIAGALEGVEGLDLGTRWTYAMCPVDTQDKGIARLVEWADMHAKNLDVPPPSPGYLPASIQASREELERAEKRHRRLVSWRWLAQRFPETYADMEGAEENAAILNDWIEQVLRNQSRMRETGRRQNFHGRPPGFAKKGGTPGKKSFSSKGKDSAGKPFRKRKKRNKT